MEKLLTTKEVCELVRVKYSTIYRWLKAGTFPKPVTERGRKMLWTPESIETWMKRSDVIIVHVPSPAEERKALQQRQKAARDAVERRRKVTVEALRQHGINLPEKNKRSPL